MSRFFYRVVKPTRMNDLILLALTMLLLSELASSNLVAIANNNSQITFMVSNTCAESGIIIDPAVDSPIKSFVYINNTIFAGVFNRSIGFFSWSTYSLIAKIATNHSNEVTDIAYSESPSSGDQFIITCSKDYTCKVFKWSASLTLYRDFTSHTSDVNVVIALSNGRIASGGNDNGVRVWDYESGSVTQNYAAGYGVRALAQIASNLLAIGGNNNNLKIWCFTNNTEIRTINAFNNVYSLVAVTPTDIAFGSSGYKTYVMNWVTGAYSYFPTSNDVIDTAVTDAMCVISIVTASPLIKVRNITALNISAGQDVCNRTFSYNLTSVVAQNPIQLAFNNETGPPINLADIVVIGDDSKIVTVLNARTCQEVATVAHAALSTRIMGLTLINSTTFAGLSNRKVAFYSSDTFLVLGYFETGHTEDVSTMAYWETASGDRYIVTGSNDDKCKVFKYNSAVWTLVLNFTAHSQDIMAVRYLSTGQIASVSLDNTAKVWSYQTGSVAQNFIAGYNLYGLAQVSSNLLAVGGYVLKIWIWNFQTNTFVTNITVSQYTRTIQVVAPNIIAVGTTGDYSTYLYDWTTEAYSKYQTNGGDVIDTAITSGMLLVSVGESSRWIKVRDVSQLNISTGNDVCNKTFSNTLRSILELRPSFAGVVNSTVPPISSTTTSSSTLAINFTDIVAIGDENYTVTLLNAHTCQEVATISHAALSTQILGLTLINSTTFAGLSNRKVAFYSSDTFLVLGYFETGHTEEVLTMAYWETDSGDRYIVTGSSDHTCKVFKNNGTAWILTLNFTSHLGGVQIVSYLSTGQIASGSLDYTVKVWRHENGSVLNSFNTGSSVYALAQISRSMLAVGGNDLLVRLWDFTNNTVIKSINSPDWIRNIQVVTSSLITVGTTGSCNTLLIDWNTGARSNYQTNTGDVTGTAITKGLLVVSIASSTSSIKVRDISQFNISVGSDVCTKSFTSNLRSVLALRPYFTGFVDPPTTTTSTTTRSTTTSHSSTNVTTLAEVLASLANVSVEFNNLSIAETVLLLTSGLDLNNCLVNCTSHGACTVLNNKLVCKCYGDYAGSACAKNLNPCSSSPCLNNGTCLITGNYTAAYESNNQTTMYACECSYGYYGPNCESKVNLCENVTCSGNGKCQDMGSTTKCNCFYLFSGDDCETESKQKAAIKTFMSVASVVAIVVIVMFHAVFVSLDMTNLFIYQKPHFNVVKSKVSYKS